MEKQKYIGLIRVATKQQEASGLGLESQYDSIEKYVASVGGELITVITEIQSAGNKDRISAFQTPSLESLLNKRPKLMEAVKLAQHNDAVLVVKEAFHLTRFTLLMDYLLSAVKFVCVDSPNDTEANIRLQTHFNELELIQISKRTKDALQVLKKTKKLGTPANLTKNARKKGIDTRRKKALTNPNSVKAMELIFQMRKNKISYRAIADILNTNGFVSPEGKSFRPGTVWALHHRKKQIIKYGK